MGYLEFAAIILIFAEKSIFTQSALTAWCVDNMKQCGHARHLGIMYDDVAAYRH